MHDGDSDGWIPLKEMASLLKDIGVSVAEDEMVKATGGDVNSSKLTSFSYIACMSISLVGLPLPSHPGLFIYQSLCILSKNRP